MLKLREEKKWGKVAHNFCYEGGFKERSEWKKKKVNKIEESEREGLRRKLKRGWERERDERGRWVLFVDVNVVVQWCFFHSWV